MVEWINIGVSEPKDIDSVMKYMEEKGLRIVNKNKNSLIATTFKSESDLDYQDVKNLMKKNEGFSGSKVCIIVSNDNEKAAGGACYEIKDSSFEKIESEDSGGPNTRDEWEGITINDLTVDGRKY